MARLVTFEQAGVAGLAVQDDAGRPKGWLEDEPGYPGDLKALLRAGSDALAGAVERLRHAPFVDLAAARLLPPIREPGKIICVGLNYVDHSLELDFQPPNYPTVFARWPNSVVGSGSPLVRPAVSEQFDYEGEIAAVIGRTCHRVKAEAALDHVAGYSIFNDGSIRDYQFKTPQWTVGKTFDRSGSFGPALVTADALPEGIRGLRIETRLNGQIVQSASTDDMIFSVAQLIEILSEAITLDPGDLIVTGTPAGVGMARTPQLWMKPGDLCEVEVEAIGTLANPIVQDTSEGLATNRN